ncbi:DNA alkylation repair protein [Amycolatopsis regifaucium]|uniref:DNA alkylation repair protein n=1 Tax=Amycolatopsis regifaucium TaxID=546365 RepID=A0A154MJP9_9PSEU|nr:DNA alkylation repair protein [Amycolatopsis regifaucium]KZB84273.1 DNA alkylation repair protein [Amycolatopsis regifaucium]OKA03635.1 DNA alkylation repair protein [Amycolatopsis regifaucium]SFJ23665.1 3-methyladenine DNA glycosylase AlkD [Amycolatopsis regifaucium]
MDVVKSLVSAVRNGLAGLADTGKATAMRTYMKSEMPFLGVPKPARSALLKPIFAEHSLPDEVSFSAAVRTLWREAEFREERYAAIDLSGHRAYAPWQDSELLVLYEEMIVTGAWWDYVDEVAIRRVGPILRAEPETMLPLMLTWAYDEDRWRRRTAVICQVGAKGRTDTDLLTRAVEANIDDKDFFLRKGIGWALREYAKTEPDWVRAFVAAHPALSNLSRKEALKHLGG